ncbi:hypothetical protein [Amycolatopsis sp. 3B14]|uniref:hypothetical protein n=1 Tax=Amycolatopsis sp. 3B14 TaxID=3243600 RepID=UPI003D95D08D
MDDDLVATAARYFAEACERSGHTLGRRDGQECRCGQLADRLEGERQARFEAETYDVSKYQLQASGVDEFPTLEWPAPALIRTVTDDLTTPPWLAKNPQRRMVKLTSALARIGERGLPPDALVRIGLRRRIKFQITSLVIGFYREQFPDELVDKLPEDLQQWLRLASDCMDTADSTGAGRDDSWLLNLLPNIEQGRFAQKLANWIDYACMRDLVAWRLEAEPHGGLDEEDLNIRGGHEAIHWIVDRFSHTHYREWYRTSLYWELRFASNPESTAAEAGVPLTLLAQRPSHTGLLVESIVSRASYALDHETLIGDISRDELLSHIMHLLQNKFFDQAINVLRAVLDRYPGLSQARCMLAFCLTPVDPMQALDELARCEPDARTPEQLLRINRAAALWRAGKRRDALESLTIDTTFTDNGVFILWQPEDLASEVDAKGIRMNRYAPKKWVHQARTLLSG